MTIYLPTLLLVAICYSTNFYLPDLFSAQVAVNLTCMLVNTVKRSREASFFIPYFLSRGSRHNVRFCLRQSSKDILHQDGRHLAGDNTLYTIY